MRNLSLALLIGGLTVLGAGCQNQLAHTTSLGDVSSLSARLGFSSDDPAAMESGKGHLDSLASELADRRLEARESGESAEVERLLKRGYDADVHGRSQEARMYYEQVLAAVPNHPEAHHRLGILADQAGDFAKAERHYQKAMRAKPDDADLLNDLGYSYFLQGRAVESERYLNQALKLEPKHPHVRENLSLLYDEAKAEKVLMSQMGPRQTQATLARLFQQTPQNEMSIPDKNPTPPGRRYLAQMVDQPKDDQPQSLDELQRKMEEARAASIARRRQRTSPGHSPGYGQDGVIPGQADPRPQQPAVSMEMPSSRINEVFRNIDQNQPRQGRLPEPPGLAVNQSSQVPPNYNRQATAPAHGARSGNQTAPTAERAAYPQWNAPQVDWPATPAPATGRAIQQAGYSEPAPTPPANRAARSAAERAAQIGMAAGPGAMFPQWNSGATEVEADPRPQPAVRSLPGTNSRVNGAMYPQPKAANTLPQWPSSPMGQNQWAGDSQQTHQPTQPAPEATQPAEVYQRMRSAQNTQFNQDQNRLAAHPDLMTSGPPVRETVPGGFDPNNQPWPAFTPEQYNTRPNDPPAAGHNAPVIVPGTPGGHTSLPANPNLPSVEIPRW